MSFMGGGSSSQTATQAAPAAQREESKQSAFTAFKGKGVSLGSETSASSRTTSVSDGQTRNLAAVSAIV